MAIEIRNSSIVRSGMSILGGIGAAGLVSRLARLSKPESRFIITDVGIKVFTAIVFVKGMSVSYDILKSASNAYDTLKEKAELRRRAADDGIREEDPDDE